MKIALSKVYSTAPIWILFLLGMYFVVIRPMGLDLASLPGDVTDTRFNNYILEHDFRWMAGLDPSLWDVPYYYPFTSTLTFSDNHLGSMFFYAPFRWLGMDRETSFQAWFILGYILNFSTVVFVLKRLGLKSLAIGAGAFFFAFGLPVLGQEGHPQLIYRFCIPLACYALWQFTEERHLHWIVLSAFGIVWQFYTNIYLGSFLLLLVLVQVVILPFIQKTTLKASLIYWPLIFRQVWMEARFSRKIIYLLLTLSQLFTLGYLFEKYSAAFKMYGLTRAWVDVVPLLPRIQSYIMSDQSEIWHSLSKLLPPIILNRGEHGLFIGGAAVILIIIGLVWRNVSPNSRFVWLCYISAAVMVALTLYVKGFSIFEWLWKLPGFNGMRAISRVILVILWPASLIISGVLDAFLRQSKDKGKFALLALGLTGFLVADSVFFNHSSFTKSEAQSRIQNLHAHLPTAYPDNPVLFVSYSEPSDWVATEIDAMLLSQDLGWPVMNGYSGHNLPGYGYTLNCDQAAIRITSYMPYIRRSDLSYFNDIFQRVVPINLGYCDPQWLEQTPVITEFSGPFPQELFSGIFLTIKTVERVENHLVVQVEINNTSSIDLPALSLTNNRFRLSWRMIDVTHETPAPEFVSRKEVAYDVPAGGNAVVTIITFPTAGKGRYYIEVSAVQESIAWFHERGMETVKSDQLIDVDENGQWIVINP